MDELNPAEPILTPEIELNLKEGGMEKYRHNKESHASFEKVGFDDNKKRRLPSFCESDDIYLCGHTSEVHRWGVDLDENDFFRQLRILRKTNGRRRVVIGIRRTNFHRLDKIFNLINHERHNSVDFPSFHILPLANIKRRFSDYCRKINVIANRNNVRVKIVDDQLYPFLDRVEIAYLKIESNILKIIKKDFGTEDDLNEFTDCEQYKDFYSEIRNYLGQASYNDLPSYLGIPSKKNLFSIFQSKTARILSFTNLCVDPSNQKILFAKRLEIIKKYGTRLENNILRSIGPICKDVFIGPRFLLLDLTRKCNTDCVYCRTFSAYLVSGDNGNNKNYPYFNKSLDLEFTNSVVKDSKALGVETVLLVGGGEPTLYPHLKELTETIKTSGLQFNISTNGIMLDKYIDIIANESCNSLTISMSFASKKSFSALRPGTNVKLMERIRKNVRLISDIKKAKELKFPRIIILHAINSLNYLEIVDMAHQAVESGADILWYQMTHLEEYCYDKLKLNKNQMKRIISDLKKAKEICDINKISFESFVDFELEHFKVDTGDWSKSALLQSGCYVGWHFGHINILSHICFCCGFHYLYDISKNGSFKDAWYSDWYARYRNDGLILHKENPVNLIGKPMYGDFCRSCDNHDQNNFMLRLIHDYNLSEFVER